MPLESWISYSVLAACPHGLCCFGERVIRAALSSARFLTTQQSTGARLLLGTRRFPPSEEAPSEIAPLFLLQSSFAGDVLVAWLGLSLAGLVISRCESRSAEKLCPIP